MTAASFVLGTVWYGTACCPLFARLRLVSFSRDDDNDSSSSCLFLVVVGVVVVGGRRRGGGHDGETSLAEFAQDDGDR
jgi:hypothetical protein